MGRGRTLVLASGSFALPCSGAGAKACLARGRSDFGMAQLTCEHLTLGYEGHAILQDVNFAVNAGDYLCIVGENGSGKSTLMKTILGLQPAMGGKISFGDGLRPGEIGYLPQQTLAQRDFPATVWEIVLSGCQARLGKRAFYPAEEKALARQNMERMGITGFAKRSYRNLSGGQQQRVLLARALCATQRLLLLDEPVSGLDPQVTAEMYALIQQLNQQEGVTILMISHDIEAALRYATHILHVNQEPFFGTREEYQQSALGRRFAAVMGGEH